MSKRLRLLISALAAVLAMALAGCELNSVPVTASTSQTATVSATVVATPSPAPAEAATPAVAATTTDAAATATPGVTTAPPGKGLTPKDYYVVERNQRAGVVDSTGRQVLPFEFASIEPLSTYTLEEGGAGTALPATQFFLCRPFTIRPARTAGPDGSPANPPEDAYDATLYDASGKAVGDTQYLDGHWLDNNLLTLRTTAAENASGVLDAWGRQIVPFHYNQVIRFAKYVVGCDTVQGRLDFYDTDGVLTKTVTVPVSGIDAYNGFLEVSCQTFDALLDANLQWLFKDKDYRSIQALGGNCFVAYDGTVGHLIDSAGKELLARPYQSIEAVVGQNGKPAGYVCSSEAVQLVAAYDAACKPLFELKGYTRLRAAGPYYIADFEGGSHVLDAQGKRILPDAQGSAQQWLEDVSLFEFYDFTSSKLSYVRPDGTKAPVPTGTSTQYLGADRFLVSTDNNHTGVCDSQGKWIVQPSAMQLYLLGSYSETFYSDDKLLQANAGDGRVGIMDFDGNWLIPPVFDWVYGRHDGLLNARKGTRSGLLDWSGHWVWSVSDYEELED